MTFPNRRLTIGLVVMLTLGAGGPLLAQRISPSPSPSVTPTIEQRFEQRYEQPTTRNRAAEREMHEMEERLRDRVQWSRPVIRIGQAFELKAEDTVHHVRGVFSDFVIDGHVTGDVVAILGDVRLGERAVIDGSLVVVGGSVTAAKGAKVGDDFTLVGGSLDAASDFAPGGEYVVIGTPAVGRGLRAFVPWVTRGLLYGRVIVPDLSWVWAVVGIALFIGVVLNLFFNRAVASCADTVARRPLSSFLMGLLVLTLMPILLTILAATVIGLVVVPLAVAAFFVAILIGRIAVSRAIGRMVLRESDPNNRLEGLRSLLIGAGVLVLAYMIPVIGLLSFMFVGSFALGSATMTAFGSWRRERPAAPPKPSSTPPHPPSSFVPEPPPMAPPPADIPPAAPAYFSAAPDFAEMRSAGVSGAAAAAATGDYTLFPRATFLDRLAAVALDIVLVGIAAAFLGFDRFRGPGPFFLLLFAYHLAFWGWKGTTLGGIICSVRIIRSTRTPLRFIDAVVRGLSAIFSIVALGIGYFWMLSDPDRQTWHDKIAGTFVVKLPRELVLD